MFKHSFIIIVCPDFLLTSSCCSKAFRHAAFPKAQHVHTERVRSPVGAPRGVGMGCVRFALHGSSQRSRNAAMQSPASQESILILRIAHSLQNGATQGCHDFHQLLLYNLVLLLSLFLFACQVGPDIGQYYQQGLLPFLIVNL